MEEAEEEEDEDRCDIIAIPDDFLDQMDDSYEPIGESVRYNSPVQYDADLDSDPMPMSTREPHDDDRNRDQTKSSTVLPKTARSRPGSLGVSRPGAHLPQRLDYSYRNTASGSSLLYFGFPQKSKTGNKG